MHATEMTSEELNAKACQAIVRELGPIGFTRFIRQFFPGRGDWTIERHSILGGLTLDEVKRRLDGRRARKLQNG